MGPGKSVSEAWEISVPFSPGFRLSDCRTKGVFQNVTQETHRADLRDRVSLDDRRGATISFAPPGPAQRSPEAADYSGAIGDVSIAYHKFVDVDGTFTIPAREFQAIQRGAMPNLLVSYVNAEGNPVHDRIELRLDLTPKGATR